MIILQRSFQILLTLIILWFILTHAFAQTNVTPV